MVDGTSGQGGSQGDGQRPAPILRRGLWNYAMDRWAPKNPTGRLAFEMAILIGFFLVLAVILKLASS
jgi:hypothetical protein